MAKKKTPKRNAAVSKGKKETKNVKKPSTDPIAMDTQRAKAQRELKIAVAKTLSGQESGASLSLNQISAELTAQLKKPVARNDLLEAINALVTAGKVSTHYSLATSPRTAKAKTSKSPQEEVLRGPSADGLQKKDLGMAGKTMNGSSRGSATDRQIILDAEKLIHMLLCGPPKQSLSQEEILKIMHANEIEGADADFEDTLQQLSNLQPGDPRRITFQDGRFGCGSST
jgi:hypothetical protein